MATQGVFICLYWSEEVVAVMGMHKLTAGSGYEYLTGQVARNDSATPGRSRLAD